jgi:hypothetical protein
MIGAIIFAIMKQLLQKVESNTMALTVFPAVDFANLWVVKCLSTIKACKSLLRSYKLFSVIKVVANRVSPGRTISFQPSLFLSQDKK